MHVSAPPCIAPPYRTPTLTVFGHSRESLRVLGSLQGRLWARRADLDPPGPEVLLAQFGSAARGIAEEMALSSNFAFHISLSGAESHCNFPPFSHALILAL